MNKEVVVVVDGVYCGVADIDGFEKLCWNAGCWRDIDERLEVDESEDVVVAVACDVGRAWLLPRSCISTCRRIASTLRRSASPKSTSFPLGGGGTGPRNLIPCACGKFGMANRLAANKGFRCMGFAPASSCAGIGAGEFEEGAEGAGAGGRTRCIEYSGSWN